MPLNFAHTNLVWFQPQDIEGSPILILLLAVLVPLLIWFMRTASQTRTNVKARRSQLLRNAPYLLLIGLVLVFEYLYVASYVQSAVSSHIMHLGFDAYQRGDYVSAETNF